MQARFKIWSCRVAQSMYSLSGVEEDDIEDSDQHAQYITPNMTKPQPRHPAIITEEFLFENGKVPFASCHASSIVEVRENCLFALGAMFGPGWFGILAFDDCNVVTMLILCKWNALLFFIHPWIIFIENVERSWAQVISWQLILGAHTRALVMLLFGPLASRSVSLLSHFYFGQNFNY